MGTAAATMRPMALPELVRAYQRDLPRVGEDSVVQGLEGFTGPVFKPLAAIAAISKMPIAPETDPRLRSRFEASTNG